MRDKPYTQIRTYITLANGLTLKEAGDFFIVASPHEIEQAQEQGCFALPVFQKLTETKLILQHIHFGDIKEKIRALLNDAVNNPQACPGLDNPTLYLQYANDAEQEVAFKADPATTEKIQQLVKELDRPDSGGKL